jgi:predicted TIM-barrel fold metal-dependent hydrolase
MRATAPGDDLARSRPADTHQQSVAGVMEQKIPFTDTHVHFWDLRSRTLRYDWLSPDAQDARLGDIGAIKSQRYWPEDFVAESRFQNVTGVVHVQAALGSPDPVQETRWLQELADVSGIPQGIVASVDLGQDDAEAVLREHARYPNVRGIRDLRRGDYFHDEAWRTGYALLGRFDLVCCDATPIELMASAAEFVREHPATTYCVDHAGYPTRRDHSYFTEWRDGMRRIAAVPNTIVKISALGTYDRTWTLESLRPWVLECIDAWGPDRVVFGTNWPVDRLFSSYSDLIDAYRRLIDQFSEAEQVALLTGTAERVFKLDNRRRS